MYVVNFTLVLTDIFKTNLTPHKNIWSNPGLSTTVEVFLIDL